MYKIIIKSVIFVLALIGILIIYLSFIGIKTSKFNNQIKNMITSVDQRFDLELDNVYLKLDLTKFSIKVNTKNSVIILEDSSIDISEINTNIDIENLLNKREIVNDIEIITKENSIKRVGNFINTYKFNLANFFLLNQIKGGNIIINLRIKTNKDLKKKI